MIKLKSWKVFGLSKYAIRHEHNVFCMRQVGAL